MADLGFIVPIPQETAYSDLYVPVREPGWRVALPLQTSFDTWRAAQCASIWNIQTGSECVAGFDLTGLVIAKAMVNAPHALLVSSSVTASHTLGIAKDVAASLSIAIAQEIRSQTAILTAHDLTAPWTLQIASEVDSTFNVGAIVRKETVASWIIETAKDVSVSHSIAVSVEGQTPFAVVIANEIPSPVSILLAAETAAPTFIRVAQEVVSTFDVGAFVRREIESLHGINASIEIEAINDIGNLAKAEVSSPSDIQTATAIDADASILISRMVEAVFDLGDGFIQARTECSSPYWLLIGAEKSSNHSICASRTVELPVVVRMAVDQPMPFASVTRQECELIWSLRPYLARDVAAPFSPTFPVQKECELSFDLLDLNPKAAEIIAIWNLLPPPRSEVGLWD
ncbi:MAG: hypothetical protein HQL07_03840 [Nitrospirae bacterium]|nr:hypothetical protein [Magnetococcales bacterium]HAT48852.1 hypothetical protein [Alphaproteobacteria bacterium]